MNGTGTVRVGLVGCGGIAQGKHIPNLLKKQGAEIAAISDVRGGQYLARVCAQYGLTGVKLCADYREVLADPGISAVHICTPNASELS